MKFRPLPASAGVGVAITFIGYFVHAHNCWNRNGKSWRSPTSGQCFQKR